MKLLGDNIDGVSSFKHFQALTAHFSFIMRLFFVYYAIIFRLLCDYFRLFFVYFSFFFRLFLFIFRLLFVYLSFIFVYNICLVSDIQEVSLEPLRSSGTPILPKWLPTGP